jgi:hypothetical protein
VMPSGPGRLEWVSGLRKRRPGGRRYLHALGARGAGGGGTGCGSGRQAAFTLGPLAGELTRTAHGFGLLTGLLLGRLLVVVPQLHLAENAFALQLFLQRAQRLIDIVIANNYLQAEPPFVIVISG